MTDRAQRLRAYVLGLADIPVVWGVNDCTCWAVNWIEAATGRNLDRPRPVGELECRRVLRDFGGIKGLWREVAAANGLLETATPIVGDVGLINLSAGTVGCIVAESGFALLRVATGGCRLMKPSAFVCTWSVPE